MVGSRVPIRRVRRLATLLVMAATAIALSGVAPATAGGKPMPAGPNPAVGGRGRPAGRRGPEGRPRVPAHQRHLGAAGARCGHDRPGPVSWKLVGYWLVGYLSAGNYLQDLTRDRAADGGNWNDRIDQIAVC